MRDPEYAPSTGGSKPQTCRDSCHAVYNTSSKQKEHAGAGDRGKRGRGALEPVQFGNRISAMGIQPPMESSPAQCRFWLPVHAFQDLRFRDAFIASDIEQGVCRTLISLFLRSRTNRPLKPGEGRVRELEKEESYSY